MTEADTDVKPAPAPAVADRAETQERLWGAALAGDEYAAVAVVFAALDAGMAPEEVLLDVIAPVQYRVGTEWAANRISVTEEHCATAINDRVIGALAHHPSSRSPATTGRVTVACVDGEWHALPARLLAEVLRIRGWQVDFLGAQVPTPHLVAHLHRTGPDAVALSCSIPSRLPVAHAAITACQAAGVPVLVGGAAFGPDGRYGRQLGADAWAADARAAAETLVRGLTRVPVAGGTHLLTDLPHLVDQEYTMITDMAPQLVHACVGELERRLPDMRSYSDAQRQHTTEDIGYIIDFLAAALYTDDDDLFGRFISWTSDILCARGVPAAALPPALDILIAQLPDFPRAQRILRTARITLADKATDPTQMP
ncbi:cobalamin B12-binding domain-containing protein [Mycolicibacterium sp. ELW1]|uniref:cobalamin B12-binding domain-containing protein n=1 Tax=Mycobacteriaceae TaxID=1762 RepID=UPI0011EDA9F2|nr:cobalamin-dependent protein [Mycobacterium sp. ELW1]QEN12131.1 cobalamin-binding protein [Mycobacterium sp. ELW1]